MDIEFVKSRLQEGEIFKNRQALCERLEVPYTNQTNSKNSQDKEWRQFFEFEKIQGTHNIRITKVYDVEHTNHSTKGSSMPKFLDPAVRVVLMSKFMDKEDKCYFTLSSVAEEVGLCSENVTKFYSSDEIYSKLKKKFSSSSNDEDKESKVFKIMAGYVGKVRSSYKSMIGGALDRIEKKGHIIVKEVTLIKGDKLNDRICQAINAGEYEDIKAHIIPAIYEKIQENILSSDQKDEPYFKEAELSYMGITNEDLREATPEEKQFIEDVCNDVAKEYGCDTMQKFINNNTRNPGKIKKYYKEINKRCVEFNVANFKGYLLSWCGNIEEDLGELRREVNKNYIEHFISDAMRKSEDNIDKKHIEKLLLHSEKGLGKMRDKRVDEMQGIEKNLMTFVDEFLRI